MTRTVSLFVMLAAIGCEGNNVTLPTGDGGVGSGADLALGGGGSHGDGGGGTGGNGADPPAPGVAPEVGAYADFVTARAHSYCTWLARCGVVAAAGEAA